MNPKEFINGLLDEAKEKLEVKSDYALAQKLEVHNGIISDFRKGVRVPDAYATTRIALVLGREPMELMAEIEAATEKSEVRRRFWQSFLSHARRDASVLVLVLALGAIFGADGTAGKGAAALAAFALAAHFLIRIMTRYVRWQAM